MAKPILGTKVGELSIADAFLIAISKNLTERVLSPFVGNATMFSGLIKTGIGVVSTGMLGGKFGKIIGTGLVIDGTEDFVSSFLGGAGGGILAGAGTTSVSVM